MFVNKLKISKILEKLFPADVFKISTSTTPTKGEANIY